MAFVPVYCQILTLINIFALSMGILGVKGAVFIMSTLHPMADLPLGFSMSLAQDMNAMKYFSDLSPDRQRAIIDQTHSITSHDEMHSFIQNLTHQHDL